MTFALAGCSPRELHIGQVEVNTGVNTAWITPARGVDRFGIPASDFSAGADGSVTYTGTAYRVLQAREKLQRENQREPTVEQIAKELDIPREEVVFAMDAVVDPVSLFDPVYSDGGDTVCVLDQVRDTRNTDESWLDRIALREAVDKLSPREQRILAMRFYDGKTQMEVSGEIGISQAQVSRLEKNAISTIRRNL